MFYLKEIEEPSQSSVEEDIIQKARIYNKDHKRESTQYEEAVNTAAGKLALDDPGLLCTRGMIFLK